MSGRYLTDLADVCRAAGLEVIEMDGWTTRARSSGGYSSGRPTHVMVHHTASGPSSDGWPDANYCTHGSENRPVANLYLNRAGTVWVMAAGATNTNGSGGPLDNVPADSMNTHAIGIEAGNGGTGEPWPTAQQDAYLSLCAQLCATYAIPPGHVRSHAEWAPGRKIDPAGPSRWTPSGTWPMDAYRADLAGWTGDGGTIESLPEVTKMYALLQDESGAMWATDSITCRWIRDGDALAWYQSMLTVFGFNTGPTVTTQTRIAATAFGVPVGPLPWAAGFGAWGWEVWNFPLEDAGLARGTAATYVSHGRAAAEQAATNTMPAGQTLAQPEAMPPDAPSFHIEEQPPKPKRR